MLLYAVIESFTLLIFTIFIIQISQNNQLFWTYLTRHFHFVVQCEQSQLKIDTNCTKSKTEVTTLHCGNHKYVWNCVYITKKKKELTSAQLDEGTLRSWDSISFSKLMLRDQCQSNFHNCILLYQSPAEAYGVHKSSHSFPRCNQARQDQLTSAWKTPRNWVICYI